MKVGNEEWGLMAEALGDAPSTKSGSWSSTALTAEAGVGEGDQRGYGSGRTVRRARVERRGGVG